MLGIRFHYYIVILLGLFLLQPTAGFRCSLFPSNYSCKLHCSSGSCSCAYSYCSLCPSSSNSCSSQACSSGCCSCCNSCSLWRIPYSTYSNWLWLHTETAGSSSTTSTSHHTELPGKYIWIKYHSLMVQFSFFCFIDLIYWITKNLLVLAFMLVYVWAVFGFSFSGLDNRFPDVLPASMAAIFTSKMTYYADRRLLKQKLIGLLSF